MILMKPRVTGCPAVGLQPLSKYTFEVEAFNSGCFQHSPPAILMQCEYINIMG